MTQQNYYELLAKKIEKQKAIYSTSVLQNQQQLFNEIATNQFRSQFQEDQQIQQFVEESKAKNRMIEEVLDKIRSENPDLDVILSKCLEW